MLPKANVELSSGGGRDAPSWSDWWSLEVTSDPAYEDTVRPLEMELLGEAGPGLFVDIGCGVGRSTRSLLDAGFRAVGIDAEVQMLRSAAEVAPVVRWTVPTLAPFRDDVLDGALMSLVLEHIAEHRILFGEVARIVRPGGSLVMVINHPVFTAPGSGPVEDPDEVLWRSGRYFSSGFTDEPAGGGTARFHHRTMAELLTTAAECGWMLERLVERGPSEPQIERHPPYARQRHIPRLLGVRWRNSGPGYAQPA